MALREAFDPGLTQKFEGRILRSINKDGSFNVRKIGGRMRDIHPYLFLVSIPWPAFIALVFAAFLLTNLFFASVYFLAGPTSLHGADLKSPLGNFEAAFFFSAQTLTTVKAALASDGVFANSVASYQKR